MLTAVFIVLVKNLTYLYCFSRGKTKQTMVRPYHGIYYFTIKGKTVATGSNLDDSL